MREESSSSDWWEVSDSMRKSMRVRVVFCEREEAPCAGLSEKTCECPQKLQTAPIGEESGPSRRPGLVGPPIHIPHTPHLSPLLVLITTTPPSPHSIFTLSCLARVSCLLLFAAPLLRFSFLSSFSPSLPTMSTATTTAVTTTQVEEPVPTPAQSGAKLFFAVAGLGTGWVCASTLPDMAHIAERFHSFYPL